MYTGHETTSDYLKAQCRKIGSKPGVSVMKIENHKIIPYSDYRDRNSFIRLLGANPKQ